MAAPAAGPDASSKSAGKTGDDTSGEDVISGPFSEYGEFDSSEDEAEDEKFFQFGRFFGVGLGAGFTTATGNAGRIYQGGFPTLDLRLDYWFDFNFALQVDAANSKHTYDLKPDGRSDVNLFRVLFQVKYYFDTRDLSAPITFVGPHLIAGGGFYQRTDNIGSGVANSTARTIQGQNAFGFNFGGGLELTLKPKKTYLQFEFLAHLVQFADQYDKHFDKGVGYYQRAIENAPSRALKAYATHALAYAYEESKQPAQAIEALRKSLGFAVPALKADTLMALARNYEQQGDKAQALAQYDTLIKDFVNTPVAKAAEARKAGLK